MIDASIALGVRPPQIDSPMNALAKVLQVREAQQGQQMNALKMDEYTQGVARKNALRQLLGGFGSDHSANQQKLLQGGYMDEAQTYGKNQADIAKTTGEAQYKQIETAHKKIDLMGQVFGFVKDNPSAESAMQATDYLVQNGIMSPEQAQATKAKIAADPSPETIRALATQAFQSALSTKDQLPKLGGFSAGDRYVQTSSNPITGKTTETGSTPIKQSANSAAVDARIATKAQAGPAPSAKPEASGFGGKPMTEFQVTKRRDQIAKDYKAATTTLSNMEDLLTSANEVLEAPGLKGATGLQSYLPSWPDGGAARAEVKLKNLEGKVTQLGKAAAAMAGAIGPMAVQEWKIVRDMIAAIEPQKGEEALKEQIRLVESTAQGAIQRMREAYELQYGADFERFPEFQNLPEAKGRKPGAPSPAPKPGSPAKVVNFGDLK